MIAYILRRIFLLPFVLFGLTLLVFGMSMLLSPTQRVATYITSPAQLELGEQSIDRLIAKYGLDDSFYIQYGRWISNVLHGNLGWSESARRPVSDALIDLLPATAELALFSSIFIIFGGVWLGTLAATHHNRLVDHISRLFATSGVSFPDFVFGLMALMIFYGALGLFPPGRLSAWASQVVMSPEFHRYTKMNVLDSIINRNWQILLDAIRHVVLPAITLGYINWALLLRMMRSSMLETLRQDYVTTARAKGLRESIVNKRHARRNALLPVITLIGIRVASLMGGVVITETVFDYNGLGRFAANAARQLDFPAILGFSLFFGTLLVVCNLAVDILYAYLDPRVRLR